MDLAEFAYHPDRGYRTRRAVTAWRRAFSPSTWCVHPIDRSNWLAALATFGLQPPAPTHVETRPFSLSAALTRAEAEAMLDAQLQARSFVP